ncbi:MAG: type II toxin-antitoxin system HicA family toxin [Oscillospiraceae bacterium]|nr:type II toxin-antitoxin system HicA family toxin [Oscillospiraceae bacterium]
MGQKEKLIAKLKTNPKTFSFDDAELLLGYFTYYRSNKGKTSGSRVMFTSDRYRSKILLHKPHPRKELLEYQVKQLIELLEQEGLL